MTQSQSAAGSLAVSAAITSSLLVGIFMRSGRAEVVLDQPARGPLTKTHARATLTDYGYTPRKLEGVRDDNHVPILAAVSSAIAMWVKFSVPGGQRNYPQVRFDVRDEDGATFPFKTSWVRQSAYIFLPSGYPSAPKRLTVMFRQGSALDGRIELPKLPPPIKVDRPHLIPAWDGLSVVRCRATDSPPNTVMLLIKAPIAPGHSLVAFADGSSASRHDACDGFRYEVQSPQVKGPAVICLPLNFPDTTKELYLELWETPAIHRRFGRRITVVGSMHPLRRALVAVPMDVTSEVPSDICRRAMLLSATTSG